MLRARRKYFLQIVLLILFSLVSLQAVAKDNQADLVAFNTQTHKVHKLTCTYAARCTRNCITIPRGDACKRGGPARLASRARDVRCSSRVAGGVPCKVCGG